MTAGIIAMPMMPMSSSGSGNLGALKFATGAKMASATLAATAINPLLGIGVGIFCFASYCFAEHLSNEIAKSDKSKPAS